jgi:osmotically-inducible protein OsmY
MDTELEHAVSGAFSADKTLSEKDLTVRVDNQIVFLKGSVDSLAELNRAERLAMGVSGTRIVDSSLINIRNGHPDSDQDKAIRQAAEQALERYPSLRRQVNISIHQGQATLTGSVETLKEKLEAHQAVSEIRGIASILNLIETAAAENADEDGPGENPT